MAKIANCYHEKLIVSFGVPAIRPRVGETFDFYDNLFLVDECTVQHMDGHVTRGTKFSVTSDALIEYNRRHLSVSEFNDMYGDDDPTEWGFSEYR